MALSFPPLKRFEHGEDFDKWIDSIVIYMSAMAVSKEAQNKSIVTFIGG